MIFHKLCSKLTTKLLQKARFPNIKVGQMAQTYTRSSQEYCCQGLRKRINSSRVSTKKIN